MAADQVRYVKVGGSFIQYVIDNSGVAIPPAVMAHTHNISDITGLQAALDGKSDTNHTHPNATTLVAGFMSAADKVKLDGLSNYTHPDSGVTPGTYRSVTVNAQGHVMAGTNPTTLAEYGISQRFVSLNPTDGFATPVQASLDLDTVAYTSYGYATTASNRPAGAAANGYFTTNAVDGTSFFQTFANPSAQDAFFYRRRNTSVSYAWLQVASREWVVSQSYLGGSGTSGTIAQFTGANTVGNSIISVSGVRVSAAGEWVSDMPSEASITRGLILRTSGKTRWSMGKFGADPDNGTNTGSNFELWRYSDTGALLSTALSINRATGNVTFSGTITASGGNSTNWNAAVPGTRTITINGVTQDLTANRSWTVAGGVAGSGTAGTIAQFTASDTVGNSIISINNGRVIAAEGEWVSDMVPSAGITRGVILRANGLNRWSFGKFALESGSDSGSDFQLWRYNDAGTLLGTAMNVSRATGNVTFSGTVSASGGNSTQWNAAVPGSRTITINGTTFDLSANRSWTVSGSGTWNDALTAGNVATVLPVITRGNSTTGNDYIQFRPSDYGVGKPYLALAKGLIPNKWEFYCYDGATTTGAVNFAVTLTQYDVPIVDQSRTLTINGTTFDLSANRSWTISTGGVGGSGNGIANRFALWTDANTLSASNLYYNGGNVGIGMVPGYQLDVSGSIRYSNQLASSVSTGTAPMIISSTTTVGNLSADMVDGIHGSSLVQTSRTITINGVTQDLTANRSWTVAGSGGVGGSGNGIANRFALWTDANTLSASALYYNGGNIGIGMNPGYQLDVNGSIRYSNQLTSTIPNGWAPFIVSSTNRVDNLNVQYLNGREESYFTPAARQLTINGTTYDLSADRSWTISGGGGVSGSGTANYLPMWNGSTSLTNSLIQFVGGILTQVNGNLYISNYLIPRNCTQAERLSMGFVRGGLVYQTDGTEGLYLNKSGGWVLVA
jgi:hypothetical protein